jgi:hypothetical protein
MKLERKMELLDIAEKQIKQLLSQLPSRHSSSSSAPAPAVAPAVQPKRPTAEEGHPHSAATENHTAIGESCFSL